MKISLQSSEQIQLAPGHDIPFFLEYSQGLKINQVSKYSPVNLSTQINRARVPYRACAVEEKCKISGIMYQATATRQDNKK